MSARNVIGEISRIHMGPKHPVITHSQIQYVTTVTQIHLNSCVLKHGLLLFVGHHFPASAISSSQLHELTVTVRQSSHLERLFTMNSNIHQTAKLPTHLM